MNKLNSQRHKDRIHSAYSSSEFYTVSFILAVTLTFNC